MSAKLSREEKLKELDLLKQKLALKEGLPHLHGMPWYKWAYEFFTSTNKYNFLCAANQISKSSTQIRKAIHWATAVELWPKLWRRRPMQFWYLYPSKSVCTIEVLKKWTEEFLPRAAYKDHPQFGWRIEIKNKEVFALHFNSGVTIYFKTYAQDANDLQTGSCDAIFCDEELPFHLYPELNMRIAATDGYFHMVFTATLGQEEWRETIEEIGSKAERFIGAFKRQVSMWDCLLYADGTESHWSPERIRQVEASCGTQAEIDRRVNGKFVVSEGLKYPSFDKYKNVKARTPLDPSWLIYAGIDPGGGGTSHPAAICFVAVRPDFKKGRVFRGVRMDGVGDTTSTDVLFKYMELRAGHFVTQARFDWADKDFGVIAGRMGVTVMPAEKSHELGENAINVLFKNQILDIDETDELRPLVSELGTLQANTPKQKAKDDFVDAMRYAVVTIPWDWSVLQDAPTSELKRPKPTEEYSARMAAHRQPEVPIDYSIDDEISGWNELYEV